MTKGKNRRRKKETLEEEITRKEKEKTKTVEDWVPKTIAGKAVKNGEISSLSELIEKNLPIIEPEIVDVLIPDLEEKLVDFKKTAKVRRAGRMFAFRASMLIGDKNQFIGLGIAKDKERFPAMKKALKNAKKNLVRVRKGCGSWQCTCNVPHSVPFKVEGRCGSVKVILLPAPKGTGLVAGDNIKDVLRLCGVKDVWCQTRGHTRTKLNFIAATVDALAKTSQMRISDELKEKMEK